VNFAIDTRIVLAVAVIAIVVIIISASWIYFLYYYKSSTSTSNTPTSVSTITVVTTTVAPPTSVPPSYNMTKMHSLHAYALNVTNLQPEGIPNNFQLMVKLYAVNYSAYEASNMQNVFFTYSNGTVIPSWLEGNVTNESNAQSLNTAIDIYWLKITSGSFLYGRSTSTIYINFDNTTANLFNNVTIGEAPQLSATYGQYDNGKNIFTDYQSFGSLNSLPEGWNYNAVTLSFYQDSLGLKPSIGTSGALYESAPSIIQNSSSILDVYGDNQIIYGTVSNYSNPLQTAYKLIDQGTPCGGNSSICLDIKGSETYPTLLATIYTSNNNGFDQAAYQSYYKNIYQGSMLIDDVYGKTIFRNFPQPFVKAIIGDNESVIQQQEIRTATFFNFTSRDYIFFDVENWDKTPQSEQNNIPTSLADVCGAIHQAGYLCAFTPETDRGSVYITSQFPEVDWKDVDLLNVQAQPFTGQGSVLSRTVNSVLANSLAYNPNLQTYVQLDMNTSNQTLDSQISNISHIPGVEGIQFTYIPDFCQPYCNRATLEAALNYTSSQKMTEIINNQFPQVYSLHDISPSNTVLYYNYNYIQLYNATSNQPKSYVGFYVEPGQQGNVYWYRVRAMPPDDIMPTVSFVNG